MSYDSFKVLKSSAVPLPIENVDTDQIIPARFLKATERKGFGDNLFRDWRFNQDNSCLLYTSPSPRDPKTSRMPSSA